MNEEMNNIRKSSRILEQLSSIDLNIEMPENAEQSF